jgi:hypothetical protein
MRRLPALLLLSTAALSARAGEAPPRVVPVLVELFTSEGCSSCPPADRLLARLASDPPPPGIEVVPLAFHVDYWDRLGWKDPFSSAAFTQRQGDYSRAFGGDRVYTPQMVVNGRKEFVGSDERVARSVLLAAAKDATAIVRLARADSGASSLRVSVAGAVEGADIVLVVSEDRVATDVPRGENAGRRLEHTNVVRDLLRIGRADGAGRFEGSPALAPGPASKAGAHAVVFVQERGTRRVLGAARISL